MQHRLADGQEATKQPYAAPELLVLGSFTELTLGTGGSGETTGPGGAGDTEQIP